MIAPDGAPVAWVLLQVTPKDGEDGEGMTYMMTDGDGSFEIRTLKEGRYTVRGEQTIEGVSHAVDADIATGDENVVLRLQPE